MKMSKNLKKFLALALALAMVFALAACGEPAPAASETPDESAAPSEDAGTGWGKEDVIPSEELFDIINERAAAAGLPALRPAGATKPLGWGPARYFEFPDALGTVGFISPLSRHFCSECNRLRVTADGKVRPCLFSDTEYDVRTALREGDDAAVRDVLLTAR